MGRSIALYIFFTLTSAFLVVFLIIVLFGFYTTVTLQYDPLQKKFVAGTIPDPPLNGYYLGSVSSIFALAWKGKIFNADSANGNNVFKSDINLAEENKYFFKTSSSIGMQDPNVKVLKLDYNVSQNPIWLRFFQEELVQVGEGKYVGKIFFKLFPNAFFALSFFQLGFN